VLASLEWIAGSKEKVPHTIEPVPLRNQCMSNIRRRKKKKQELSFRLISDLVTTLQD